MASGDVELARDQRLADYYAASGTSPGRWHGHGLEGVVLPDLVRLPRYPGDFLG